MSLVKHFNGKLDELWRKRTAELRALAVPRGQGRPAILTKATRQTLTDDLLETASELLLKREGSAQLREVTVRRSRRHIKGWGHDKRFKHIIEWAKDTCDGPIVYAFWRGTRCLYVGKGESWRRLRGYAKHMYLTQTTRIEVFCVRGMSNLGKAECLTKHLFNPRDNKNKPARAKWGKDCPICKKHDRIRSEVATLFRFK